jgi:hypothetical protein
LGPVGPSVHGDGTDRVARPVEAHRTRGRGALWHRQRQEAFGGDGTHWQRGWDGKDGEQERRRGMKAADVGCRDTDTAAASDSTVASDRGYRGGA